MEELRLLSTQWSDEATALNGERTIDKVKNRRCMLRNAFIIYFIELCVDVFLLGILQMLQPLYRYASDPSRNTQICRHVKYDIDC